jgi:hypothetical protein
LHELASLHSRPRQMAVARLLHHRDSFIPGSKSRDPPELSFCQAGYHAIRRDFTPAVCSRSLEQSGISPDISVRLLAAYKRRLIRPNVQYQATFTSYPLVSEQENKTLCLLSARSVVTLKVKEDPQVAFTAGPFPPLVYINCTPSGKVHFLFYHHRAKICWIVRASVLPTGLHRLQPSRPRGAKQRLPPGCRQRRLLVRDHCAYHIFSLSFAR